MKIVIHRHCRLVKFMLIILSDIGSIENSGHHWIQGWNHLLNSTIYHNFFPNFRTFILDIASFWNRKVRETLKVIQKFLKSHGTRLWSTYFYSNNWWKVKKGPLIISNLSNNCLSSIKTNTTTCFRWVFEREFRVFLPKICFMCNFWLHKLFSVGCHDDSYGFHCKERPWKDR